MSLISIKNIHKKYKNGVVAIQKENLKINKGEFVFVIGASGSGKSTLIKMMYREELPTSGEILIGGIDVSRLKNHKVYKLRRKIGVVFQDYKLLPKLTVFENVAFALEVFGLKKEDVHKRVVEALNLVGLKLKSSHYPHQLSGGEQQRVAIARAIVNGPKLLICDEPTGNLDPKTSMGIINVLEEINKLGTTLIIATHDKNIVDKLQKRVVSLADGRIVSDVKKGNYTNEVA